MFSTKKPFTLIRYSPNSILTMGEVEYSNYGSCTFDKLAGEVKDTAITLGDSLNRAYGVKTVVERPKVNTLSTKISPLVAKLKSTYDIDIRAENLPLTKYLRGEIGRVKGVDKAGAVIRRDDRKGFFMVYKLENPLNPKTIGQFMLVSECFMLRLAGFEIGRNEKEIEPDAVKIEVEVNMPEQAKPPNSIMYG